MKRWIAFSLALVVAGCAAPAQRFESKLQDLGGAGSKDCGLVALHQPAEQSISCALSSLSSKAPFEVGFQLQGIDSKIWEGLVLGKSGMAQRVRFDSDASGGYSMFPHSRVKVEACPSPSISVSPSGAVSCASGR